MSAGVRLEQLDRQERYDADGQRDRAHQADQDRLAYRLGAAPVATAARPAVRSPPSGRPLRWQRSIDLGPYRGQAEQAGVVRRRLGSAVREAVRVAYWRRVWLIDHAKPPKVASKIRLQVNPFAAT